MKTGSKKELGQHWLNDPRSLRAVCQAAKVTKTDTVLEIGPGKGSLTTELIKRAAAVVAVELDSRLAARLPVRLPAGNLQVVEADILRFNLGSLPPGYKLVANIPYYLTSHLLRILYESANPPAAAALLLQKEVAERLAAQPGSMSLLSVSVQLKNEVRLGRIIPAALFSPPPKVDSQIVSLKLRDKPLFTNLDEKTFFRLARAGFSSRRKKLRGSLSAGLAINKAEADELLKQAGINGNLRAQNLSLDNWYQLYRAFQNDQRNLKKKSDSI